MDPDGLPVIGTGVDYYQVGAIHQKRTLAFINYFVTSTVSFLNNFSRSCEVKLQKCESRIQKLEASLGILEAKLSSIPGLDEIKPVTIDALQNISLEPDASSEVETGVPSSIKVILESSETPSAPSDMIPVKEDPMYKKFFRMLQVGVPEPAVKLKMKAEGLDPEMLSNPDQLVPVIEDLNNFAQSQDSGSGTD